MKHEKIKNIGEYLQTKQKENHGKKFIFMDENT